MLNVTTQEGGWGEVKEIQGSPIPADDVLQNIRDTAEFDWPVVRKIQPTGKTVVFVAGGPTLTKYMEEIRERKARGDHIMTSNNTHDVLVSNGIIPDSCLLFDPKKRVADYVLKPQKECVYYLATVVHKDTAQRFKDYGVEVRKVVIAYGLGDETDIKLQKQFYPQLPGSAYLVGGTMTPLRAMPFACMLGFTRIEFYGFDSCFGGETPPIIKEGDGGYEKTLLENGVGYEDAETGIKYAICEPPEGGFFYAYKKKRSEDVVVAQVGPRRFLTSPGFAYQAKQLVLWAARLEGKLEIVVHGDSLSSCLLNAHYDRLARLKQEIGDRRWTEEYEQMQRVMHSQGMYGIAGTKNRAGLNVELAGRLVLGIYQSLKRPITLLDYGAGNGDMVDAMNDIFKICTADGYDPFHDRWAGKEDVAVHDIVLCTDVMEHVEEQCVENTIRWIANHSRYGAMFVICVEQAFKHLPNGQNAHVTIKNAYWWRQKLEERFKIGEFMDGGRAVVIMCQKRDAEELIAKEAA